MCFYYWLPSLSTSVYSSLSGHHLVAYKPAILITHLMEISSDLVPEYICNSPERLSKSKMNHYFWHYRPSQNPMAQTADVDISGFPVGYFIIKSAATGRVFDVYLNEIEDGTDIVLSPEKEKSMVESESTFCS
jgi:hypothetical protein